MLSGTTERETYTRRLIVPDAKLLLFTWRDDDTCFIVILYGVTIRKDVDRTQHRVPVT